MRCFCGSDGAGNLLSKFVLLVVTWLLLMATSVTARLLANVPRPVSSAVQESLSTDEVAALKDIASALNRNVELLSNNWSWIKVGVLSFVVLFLIEIWKIFTGVCTQYLGDWLKEAIGKQDPLAASANPVADPGAQQADRGENQTNSKGDGVVEALKNVNMDPHHRGNPPLLPRVEPEASAEKGKQALIEERGRHDCFDIEAGKQVS